MPKTYFFSSFPDYSSPGFCMKDFISLFDDGNVIISARSSDVSYDEHDGSFTLKCAFKGEEHYSTRKCRYRVDDHSFLVIKKGNLYSSYIRSFEEVESFSIFFNHSLINNVLYSLYNSENYLADEPEAQREYDFPADVELHRYSGKILSELLDLKAMISRGFGEDGIIRERLQSVLEILFLRNREINKAISGIPVVNRATKEEYYKRLKVVMDYIHSNCGSGISIETLSGIACMNPCHFIRVFKKVCKVTPYTYLTNVRLERSKRLLEKTDLPVTEIASLVGFERLSSFSYLFHKKYNVSPSGYRTGGSKKVNIEKTLQGGIV